MKNDKLYLTLYCENDFLESNQLIFWPFRGDVVDIFTLGSRNFFLKFFCEASKVFQMRNNLREIRPRFLDLFLSERRFSPQECLQQQDYLNHMFQYIDYKTKWFHCSHYSQGKKFYGYFHQFWILRIFILRIKKGLF